MRSDGADVANAYNMSVYNTYYLCLYTFLETELDNLFRNKEQINKDGEDSQDWTGDHKTNNSGNIRITNKNISDSIL